MTLPQSYPKPGQPNAVEFRVCSLFQHHFRAGNSLCHRFLGAGCDSQANPNAARPTGACLGGSASGHTDYFLGLTHLERESETGFHL